MESQASFAYSISFVDTITKFDGFRGNIAVDDFVRRLGIDSGELLIKYLKDVIIMEPLDRQVVLKSKISTSQENRNLAQHPVFLICISKFPISCPS